MYPYKYIVVSRENNPILLKPLKQFPNQQLYGMIFFDKQDKNNTDKYFFLHIIFESQFFKLAPKTVNQKVPINIKMGLKRGISKIQKYL